MRNFERLQAPDYLQANFERWSQRYAANRNNNHGHMFQWPQINGTRLNQLLLPLLKLQTQNHCSYCDGYPLGPADKTIDHFKPKSDPRFYLDVCSWENLYVACADCQDLKGTQYDEFLLRPDEIGYEFLTYFEYDYLLHKINTRPNITDEQKLRADYTRTTLGFNEPSFCKAREMSFGYFTNTPDVVLDDCSHRFIL